MTVLAIDLGRNLGWVLGGKVGPLRHGTIQLPDTANLGAFQLAITEQLRELIQEADAIAIEKPIVGGKASGYFAIRKNFAALGMVHYLAHIYGQKPVEEISPTTGKLTLAGHGQADKDKMIWAAIEKGLPAGITEHEADAYGIWWVFIHGAREPISRRTRSGKGRSILKGDE